MNVHIVQKGDTLWKIARQNGVSFDELKRMNAHLANPDYIVPGMKIFLPDKAAGKKEQVVHPFTDGRPPKTVVLPEKEKVVEVPVVEMPKEKVKEVVVMPPMRKEKMKEVVVMPPAPVQPSPIQPINMPQYHAVQYVPITKNFYSVQQAANVQQAPPPPPPPVVVHKESPMVEEIIEEHIEEPMEVPMMVNPCFTGPICGCMPFHDCFMPIDPCCHPFMQPYPMFPMQMPYWGGPGYMPGMIPEPMVQGVMSPEFAPQYMPATAPQYVPEQMMEAPPEMMPMMESPEMMMPMMETPEVAGQMAVNPTPTGWVLESSSDEPSSFLEKFEHHHHHHAHHHAHIPGQVAGAYAPQAAPMVPEYYSYQQPGYPMSYQQPGFPMAAAPYDYNPYMMHGFGYSGYGPGPCNCY